MAFAFCSFQNCEQFGIVWSRNNTQRRTTRNNPQRRTAANKKGRSKRHKDQQNKEAAAATVMPMLAPKLSLVKFFPRHPVARKLVGHNASVACGDAGKVAGVDNHGCTRHRPHEHQQQHVAHEHNERIATAKVICWLWTKNEMSAKNEWCGTKRTNNAHMI